jgi:thiol-disulfide isomerase/thioredoxin
MVRYFLFVAVIFAALCLLPPEAPGQETDTTLDPIKWSIKASPSPPNGRWSLELTARIESGWHLYSTERIDGGPSPTRITLAAGQPFEIAGEIDSPASRSAYDPNFQVATEFYEGAVAFTIPVRATNAAGAHSIRVQVRYQTCTATLCLPPKLIELEVRINAEVLPAKPSPTPTPTSANGALSPGAMVPDFNFTDFNGSARHFSEYRGRVVLLDFWASWCSPCLADIPQLKGTYEKFHTQGFEIIGMNSETVGQTEVDPSFLRDAQAQARAIVRRFGVSWTQSNNESSVAAAKLFGIESLPAKFLIDREGRLVVTVKNVAELDALLAGLLKSKP